MVLRYLLNEKSLKRLGELFKVLLLVQYFGIVSFLALSVFSHFCACAFEFVDLVSPENQVE